jgi:hypothetical protein
MGNSSRLGHSKRADGRKPVALEIETRSVITSTGILLIDELRPKGSAVGLPERDL